MKQRRIYCSLGELPKTFISILSSAQAFNLLEALIWWWWWYDHDGGGGGYVAGDGTGKGNDANVIGDDIGYDDYGDNDIDDDDIDDDGWYCHQQHYKVILLL